MSESGSNEGKEESQSKRQRVQQEESNVVSSANVPLESKKLLYLLLFNYCLLFVYDILTLL